MQGEKVGEESGKVTSQRVLPNPGGVPKMETSFQADGKLAGVEMRDVATYSSAMRPDGTMFGEGNGLIMGKGGELCSWSGSGIGAFTKEGGISFRGAIYYQSSAGKWQRLNGIAGIFEFDVDAQGNTRGQIWEWK
jgi:hypothetical protein